MTSKITTPITRRTLRAARDIGSEGCAGRCLRQRRNRCQSVGDAACPVGRGHEALTSVRQPGIRDSTFEVFCSSLGLVHNYMPCQITVTDVAAIPTAVIRSRVQPKDLLKFVPTACGEVWSFIRSAGLPRPGHHVALYLDDGMVEVGAEVSERFTGNKRVCCSELPAGRVATATHFGPHGRRPAAGSAAGPSSAHSRHSAWR